MKLDKVGLKERAFQDCRGSLPENELSLVPFRKSSFKAKMLKLGCVKFGMDGLIYAHLPIKLIFISKFQTDEGEIYKIFHLVVQLP